MQAELARCLFPIGDFLKSDVRVMARRAGLPTAEKKDSQGICFLGNISVEDFLKQHIPEKRGALMTTTGLKIGEHSGAEFYTIGERHLNANFKFPKTGGLTQRKPFYVASKDAATNTVTVAEGNENPALYRKELTIANVNFINSSDVSADISARSEVFARVRYRQPLAAATLSALEKGHYQLVFNKPQKFVAPGQSAVFYSSEGEMLGGGVIL
jgi:tRNA-specific 2-thiouridylase